LADFFGGVPMDGILGLGYPNIGNDFQTNINKHKTNNY